MLTSDHHAQNQSLNPQTKARSLRGMGLVTVTALPLLAALLAACNPGTAPSAIVAASNSPAVRPSARPTPSGSASSGTSVRPGASGSPGSQSLSSASPLASSGSGSGTGSGSGSGSGSASPAASASAAASASPAANASSGDENVYDTAIHLSEPVEARYVFKQRSDFSSLYPTVRYSSYPYYGGGYGSGYGSGYDSGYGYPMSSPYYPSIFGKIESNTTVKFRFEPKPSRTMLVDLWLENRNYGSMNYSSPTPYPSVMATAYPYYDISTVERSHFAVAQASGTPTPMPSATATPMASASPVYTEHYQVLVRLNGEIKEYIEPEYIVGTGYTAQVYQHQIASLLRPFFSSYSPELVRLGISWPARDNLFTEFDTLAGSSGQLRTTRSPSWSMESGGKTVELSYRSEVKVTSKDGDTETVQSFKESAKASIDPATGLMLKLTSSLSVDDDDKTPYYLELERL